MIEIFGVPYLKKGSGIHIKKKNRGKFTEYCGGEVTDECIQKAKKSKNPKLRKRATFAQNARGWSKKEQDGGTMLKTKFVNKRSVPGILTRKHEEGAKMHKPYGHKSILDNGWMKDRKVAKGSGGTFPGFWDDTMMYSPEITEVSPIAADINKRNYVGEVKKLPYAQTVQFIRNLENPKEKGMKNGVARAYDSRTAGYGTDFVSGHPELAAKIRSGKWTTQEAKDQAVTDMRNHDRVIMENLQQYTTRPDTISPGPRLLAAQARYHYGNIRKDFDEWGKAIANGDAETQKKIALKLSKGYDDRNQKIQEFDIYGL